jgi:hypothetical protein
MLMYQVVHDEPQHPRRLNHSVPRDLETICLKCLEKDPNKRYQTAAQLAEDLRRFLTGEPLAAKPVGTVGRIWRWYCRKPEATVLVAGGYTLFCTGLLILWELEGMILMAFGTDPTPLADTAMVEMSLAVVLLYVPAFWSGIRAINGRRGALWVGLAVSVFAFVLCVLTLVGVIDIAAVRGHPSLRMPLLTLLANFSLAGIIVHLVAISSRRSAL